MQTQKSMCICSESLQPAINNPEYSMELRLLLSCVFLNILNSFPSSMRPLQTPINEQKPHYCDCVESYKKCTNSKGLLMMYSAFEDKTRKSLWGTMGDVHSHKHAAGAAVRREW